MALPQTVRPGSRFRVRPLILALAATGLATPLASPAATIVVTDGGDAGSGTTCTLRQAVGSIDNGALLGTCVNSGAVFGTNDTVDLSAQVGVITLGGTEIAWTGENIRFVGPAAGPTALRISGNGASRVFNESLAVTNTVIENLTIENGLSSGPGGCVLSHSLSLLNSIVTGCTATRGTQKYGLGWGGGVAAYGLYMFRSTIAGNTAADGGGGAFSKYGAQVVESTIANNTVVGSTCLIEDSGDLTEKYRCLLLSAGGGGLLTGTANFFSSTVSGNTVNATFLDVDSVVPDGHIGVGGGITVLGAKYYYDYDSSASKAKLKPTFAKARATLMATERGRQAVAAFEARAEVRAKARAAWRASTARVGAKKRKGNKVDGYQEYGLGLFASTVSGNRVQGPNNPAVNSKYLGGGVASLAFAAYSFPSGDSKYVDGFNNDEIANSTISGNRLPFFPPPPADPPPDDEPTRGSIGGAMLTGMADFSNSTIVDNTSQLAGVAFAVSAETSSSRAAKAATTRRLFEPAWRWSSSARMQAGATRRARNKDFTPMVWESTIIANNPGIFDVTCSGPTNACDASGSNNLIRTPGMSIPPDTIVGVDPQLAPLANNGGTVTGAAGHVTTGPLKTHALYVGSPALNTGINSEGFEFDERGPGFPRVTGPAADIGAYEGSVPKPNPLPVPGLGPWALGLLSALLGALGLARRRSRPG